MAWAIFGTDAFRRFNAQFTFGSTLVVVQGLQGRPPSRRAKPMWIMVVYTLIVLVGETVTVGIGLVLDRIYPAISLYGFADAVLFHPLVCLDSCGSSD
jgi:hypothetical protein